MGAGAATRRPFTSLPLGRVQASSPVPSCPSSSLASLRASQAPQINFIFGFANAFVWHCGQLYATRRRLEGSEPLKQTLSEDHPRLWVGEGQGLTHGEEFFSPRAPCRFACPSFISAYRLLDAYL